MSEEFNQKLSEKENGQDPNALSANDEPLPRLNKGAWHGVAWPPIKREPLSSIPPGLEDKKQQRSYSFSLTEGAEMFPTLSLMVDGDECMDKHLSSDDEDDKEFSRFRNRSQSTAAAIGLGPFERERKHSVTAQLSDLSSIWSDVPPEANAVPSLFRAPSSSWDHGLESSFLFRQETGVIGSGRRKKEVSLNGLDMNDAVGANVRRHSIAVTTTRFSMMESFENLSFEDKDLSIPSPIYEEDEMNLIDEEGRIRGGPILGKGVSLQSVSHHESLFVVEFKSGRCDVFYVPDGSKFKVKLDDHVVVEGDRGMDMGKVVNDSLAPKDVPSFQQKNAEFLDAHRGNKELYPKKIFRVAQPSENILLTTKATDEEKAVAVCQAKVKQKKLPMEVVDGEYQW